MVARVTSRSRRGHRRQRDQLARLCGAAGQGRLGRVRARAQRLHLGGAIQTAETHRARVSARRLQRLASALGRRRGARGARGRACGARARVPEHRLPDGDALSRRRGGVPAAKRGRERRGARRVTPRATAPPGAACSTLSIRTPIWRSECSAPELWSKDGLALGLKAYNRLGRRGLAEFTGTCCVSSRDWLTSRSPPSARTGCSRRGCCTPGSARTRPPSGFMSAGDRRRDSGGRDADPARRRRSAGRCARPADPR